jgi:hypothetical protein
MSDDRFHWEYRPPTKVLSRFYGVSDGYRWVERLTEMAPLSGLAPLRSVRRLHQLNLSELTTFEVVPWVHLRTLALLLIILRHTLSGIWVIGG